jgi:hypothetical protein
VHPQQQRSRGQRYADLKRASQEVIALQQTSQSTQLATPAFAQMTPSLKEPVCEPIGRTSKGRTDASLYWALVVIVSSFQSPPDNAYFSDETSSGSAFALFYWRSLCSAFSRVFNS